MKASKIVIYLKRKGHKGDELAEILKVSRATISHLESGETEKLNFQYIERAAQFLNKTTPELLAELEEM